MTQVRTVTKRAGIHATLILMVLISSVPFYWAVQNSIKFTRDTISKIPTLWGFDVTADPYRRFWFHNEEQNMWAVGLFFVVLAAVIALIVVAKRMAETKWPFNLAIVASLWVALWIFPSLTTS